MSRVEYITVDGFTQTLEATTTSASNVLGGRLIELRYPPGSVTGVYNNSGGTGTNFWTVYPDDHPKAKQRQVNPLKRTIVLPPDSGLGASTACWVTYKVNGQLMPVKGGFGASGFAGPSLFMSKGVEHTFTGEMTAIDTGTPEEAKLEPAIGGLAVRSVRVITDGTDVDVYVYKASTASYTNLIYAKMSVNKFAVDDTLWMIPIDNTSVWVGYVDNNADATPAKTRIEIRGASLV